MSLHCETGNTTLLKFNIVDPMVTAATRTQLTAALNNHTIPATRTQLTAALNNHTNPSKLN